MSETPAIVAIELEKVRAEMRAGFEAISQRFEHVDANIATVALAVDKLATGQNETAALLREVAEHLGAVKEPTR